MKPCFYVTISLLIAFNTSGNNISKTSLDYIFSQEVGYTQSYSEQGVILENQTLNTFISGVEQLVQYEVLLWNGKKWKEQSKKTNYESDYNTGFYSGQKVLRTPLTGPATYSLNWQKKCDYNIYCSKVYFNPKADTSIVKISLPSHLVLAINWKDTIGHNTVDYLLSEINEFTVHTFTYKNNNSKKSPIIRVLVRDTSSLTNAQAFSASYLQLIQPVLQQPAPASMWLDSIHTSSLSQNEKVKEVFEYVKLQISYIQISNGLDGLCPRPVSYTLYQKQGDCKAMALTIHKYLNFLQIPNKLAISASINYKFDMDFPTVSSGNHMVCVYLPTTSEMVVLDPTDKFCTFPQPSRHTQNTTVFLLDQNHPEFRDISSVQSRQATEIKIILHADTRDGQIFFKPAGTFKWLDTETYSGTENNRVHLQESLDLSNTIISDVQRHQDTSYTGKIEINKNNILPLNEILLINQSFLPDPSKLINSKRNYTYQPAQHSYHITIVLPKEYHLTAGTNKSLDTDLYSYSYSNQITTDNVLHIKYALHVKSCRYSVEQITQLQQLQTIIQNDFKTVLTLQ
ncbi:MAG: hypothetical protein ACPGRC_11080 [Salibacteraceae bacterium]